MAQQPNKDSRKTTPAFLSNLGKATLRGIRKCPQCGVYNGTRGLSCKNKACGISLRNASAGGRSNKKGAVEVVKVIIDSEDRVFSVCHKGRGATATQLGFVELVPTDTAIATGDGATLLTRINLGRCFLPSCRQGQSLCVHIKQAIECQSCATPLTLKSSVLEGLQVSIQDREELWRLATESPGPLVQRVAKDTLVVKCHTDSHHPLGLLHLTVGASGLSEVSKSERKSREPQQSPPSGSVTPQPCLHFYACVCAFASDEKLASEFAGFINYTPNGNQQNAPCIDCPSEKSLQPVEPVNSHHKTKRLRPDESVSGDNILIILVCGAISSSNLHVCLPGSVQVVDERTVNMSFHHWLASVTERIHQAMHYQFNGKPDPLVYHIPQEFFNALQHRLSLGSKKRRLPNFTTAFVRNDGLPLGSFSKYTWHITNPMQVKRIFDTPELSLELTQSFVKNADGSYSRFHCPEPPLELEVPEGCRTERPQAIRPMELRTFLKVGECSADQKDASPFVIEWIPDVLPLSRVGELRISFEFGHQQSGQPDYCEKNNAADKGGRNKLDSTQSKRTVALEIVQVVV
uniref:Chromosome 2 open reading frame 42 n=1 Tax=Sphaeramia orbicularis TaxID=375764 RepID=A0A673B3Y6_9TELE